MPKAYNLAGVPVKVLFAPDHTPELEIMKQMLKGTERGRLRDLHLRRLLGHRRHDARARPRRHDDPRRARPRRRQHRTGRRLRRWLHPNIELFVPKKSGVFQTLRKLHHKLMVIDEQVVVAGSFNYTAPANEYNDENIFVLGSVFPKVEKITVNKAACQALAAT